jgi:ubiquitin related modifier 1
MVLVKVEFLGGLDQVFGGVKNTKVNIEGDTVRHLYNHLAKIMINNDKDLEMFIQEDTIRPGILVLVNDTDWELEDKEDCILEDGDLVSFTSTLHGG